MFDEIPNQSFLNKEATDVCFTLFTNQSWLAYWMTTNPMQPFFQSFYKIRAQNRNVKYTPRFSQVIHVWGCSWKFETYTRYLVVQTGR